LIYESAAVLLLAIAAIVIQKVMKESDADTKDKDKVLEETHNKS
jgi:hypothetical protein